MLHLISQGTTVGGSVKERQWHDGQMDWMLSITGIEIAMIMCLI